MKTILIIGAGGQGKVVYDAIYSKNDFSVIGFADDSKVVGAVVIDNCKVVSSLANIVSLQFDFFVVAIGDNVVRTKIFNSLSASHKATTVIHPLAAVSKFASIGDGTVILANSTIQAGASVGKNVIVNANCLVDHDTVIGNNTHLSQGTIVGSECVLKSNFKSEMGQFISSRTIQ